MVSHPEDNSRSIQRAPSVTSSLNCWLSWLENLHSTEIDLGLERVSQVADQAGLLSDLPVLITVAGTNGKGSVVAYLTSLYSASGYRTGSYTSPHISIFNERICIGLETASDQEIIDALAWVESHRAGQSLTYFEFTTLAAMRVFKQCSLDVILLEVGLGGRLDAVNIWDTDCAIITSIALDHEAWLGNDLEAIGFEKAGIARANKPLVLGSKCMPASIHNHARAIGAKVRQCEDYFAWRDLQAHWELRFSYKTLKLPAPALSGAHQLANAAVAMAAAETLKSQLPVTYPAILATLTTIQLAGRFERRRYRGADVVLDVAHNQAAAQALCFALQQHLPGRRAHVILSIMADKDVDAVIAALSPCAHSWYCGNLDVERAMPAAQLAKRIKAIKPKTTARAGESAMTVSVHESVSAAFLRATEQANQVETDYVLVCGSFFTLAAIVNMDGVCQ